MKILILGGQGLVGSMLVSYLSRTTYHALTYTARQPIQHPMGRQLDVRNTALLQQLFQELQPEVVINCLELLPAHPNWSMEYAIYLNSLFPHCLLRWADHYQFRLIHISTASVFDGAMGDYHEMATPNNTSPYGRSKSLGEFSHPLHVVIRTSFIGPERKNQEHGLLSWFLAQEGSIYGHEHVRGNCVTTLELAKMISWLLNKPLGGMIHLGGRRKISHYELLCNLQATFQRTQVKIEALAEPYEDLTLVSTRGDFDYYVTPYERMFEELKHWIMEQDKEGFQ